MPKIFEGNDFCMVQETGGRERAEPAASTGEGPASTETQEVDQVCTLDDGKHTMACFYYKIHTHVCMYVCPTLYTALLP